jgi:hypothetical protein
MKIFATSGQGTYNAIAVPSDYFGNLVDDPPEFTRLT